MVAYLVGSIPTSFIVARLLRGVDIRDYGSGNVGATNLSRVAGKKPAIFVLLVDIGKGIFAVTVVAYIFAKADLNLDFYMFKLILGLAAICGHIWPVFLRFRGGKGVATSAGVMLIIAPKVLVIGILIWLIIVIITRYVSLGSILSSVSLPVSAAVLGEQIELVTFCVILCIIGTYKHKLNISRLIRNEEPKIWTNSKK